MRTRRQKVSEDRQAIVGRLNAGENSLHIPDELILAILLRLPAKCLARCRCLSKLWASLLEGQDFTDRYLKISSARPQLLFAVAKNAELLFSTSPHHLQNQEDDNTCHAAVNYHMSFPIKRHNAMNLPMAVNGLVCARDKTVCVICNPSTGQSFTLPRIKTRGVYKVIYFFGYDPVDKQFKVLSIGWARGIDNAISQEHQVLTLETGKLSWRIIECGVPHSPLSNSVCINGVLYYQANIHGSSSSNDTIMSFDVRSEKYSFIKVMEPGGMHPVTNLINYNGKLALISASEYYYFYRKTTSFEMWVLDDLEKKEWSKHVYKLPPIWGDHVAADYALHCAGVTCSNELVLVQYSLDSPFYVLYYSLQTGTSRIVEIQGMEALRNLRVYTFVDHVEDVKLLKGVLGL